MGIKDEELARFCTGIGIRINVDGRFIHTDMGPNEQTLFDLRGAIACNRRVTTFEPELVTSQKAKPDKRQKATTKHNTIRCMNRLKTPPATSKCDAKNRKRPGKLGHNPKSDFRRGESTIPKAGEGY